MKSLSEYIKEQLIQEAKPSVNWVVSFFNDIVINGSSKKYDGKVYIFSQDQIADGNIKNSNSKVYDTKNTVGNSDIVKAVDDEKFVCIIPKDKKVAEILIDNYEFEDFSKAMSMDNAVSIFVQKLVDKDQDLAKDILNDKSIC